VRQINFTDAPRLVRSADVVTPIELRIVAFMFPRIAGTVMASGDSTALTFATAIRLEADVLFKFA